MGDHYGTLRTPSPPYVMTRIELIKWQRSLRYRLVEAYWAGDKALVADLHTSLRDCRTLLSEVRTSWDD